MLPNEPRPNPTPMTSWRALFCVLALLAGAVSAGDRIAFADLTSAEQRVLMPFSEQWSSLSPETQQNLRLGARRWNGLNPQQKREAARRFGDWQKLPDSEKRRVRERYRAFRQLPPEQQQRLRGAYVRFQQLPPAQRAQMRERFQRMSPDERRAWLDGLRAERPPGARERLRSQLPPEQRAATQEMMARFTPAEILRVRAHVRGLAPAERRAFHDRLLAMGVEQRIAYIATLPAPEGQPAR
jgi:hypothetical protein